MNAGDLDRRVQFRRATLTDNGLNQTEGFADHGSPVWAAKRDVSDGEKWGAGQVNASILSRFQVRASSFTRGLTAKDRLVCDGREYGIIGLKELGRDGIEITAQAEAD
ncbi:head-tail adaptor protein [Rubellimicrobium arenae]|uniref:head-tail adaptor protein n=1 Tax=Rubellimicrobium arenae TaxID=2817372 RepID=UPI001B30DB7E|nr:head-tail adaptor protein [Rubellimicrobium arenae]